ncbi:hypothetical protein BH23VER1_BH23VER1_17780 [soil metagenome]
MPTIGDASFAAIDFESAGTARGATDVPIQVGIALLLPCGTIPRSDLFVSYIATDRPVTWAAQIVHGISTGDLRGAPSLADLWSPIRRALAHRAVVAHGAATEKRFLRAFPLHGFGPWVDTLTLARAAYPGLGDYSLGSLCERLNLTAQIQELCPDRGWHDALFDSVASLALLRHTIEVAEIRSRPLTMLTSPADS